MKSKTTTKSPNLVGKCPLWRAPCPETYCAWWLEERQECAMVAMASLVEPGHVAEPGEVALREGES